MSSGPAGKLLAVAAAFLSLTVIGIGESDAGAEHKHMKLVGFNDLQARSAYQPWVQKQGNRWIAYIGHHGGAAFNPLTNTMENNGTSIVDVTDPKRPVYLKHIPGPSGAGEAGGAQMVRLCDGGGPNGLPSGVPGRTYMLRSHGDIAHQVWDVTNPSNPILVSTPVEGLNGTHKSWWECNTGIAYLVSGVPGWRTNRMTQVFDLSNPAAPVFIRNYGLVGQQPGSAGLVPQSLHGPISTGPPPGIRGVSNRIYFGHGTGSNGILQIVDRLKLIDPENNDCSPTTPDWRTNPTEADLLCPQLGRLDTSPTMGAHTVYPLLRQTVPEFVPHLGAGNPLRDIIVLVNEAGGGSGAGRCTGNRQMVYMVDITDPSKPMGVANFNVPEESGKPPFCDRGGRFGAHASNENFTPIYYGKLVFVSWFNAGVRAIDVRDPWSPREAGYFIPETTANTDVRCTTIDGQQICNFAIQTNNVEVDDRGYIYPVDRANTGMHILKLTGPAAKIADLPDD